ncbi:MAG TPA: hypothetical protein VHR45_19115 [Thermoanaerobaculia bacterium]|nr:hypothetical protein [Thermoanaerobaculia bacterium]
MITVSRHRLLRTTGPAACFAVLLLAASRPTAALERFGIRVLCAINSGQLTDLYGERRVAEITTKLCQALLARLVKHREFQLWSFGTAVRKPPAASLTFTVSDHGSEATKIRLEFAPNEGEPVHLSDTWINIGDAHPGDSDLALSQLEQEFESHIEGPWKSRLEEGLKQIPVAEARSLEAPGIVPVRIVSSLPFKSYQHLRSSHFKVICPRPGYQSVTLASTGRPQPAPYQPTGTNHSSYEALVVVVVGRVEDDRDHTVTPIWKISTQLRSLTPRILLFDRFDPPGWEAYLP